MSEEFQSMLSANGTQSTLLRSLDVKNGVAPYDSNPQSNMNGFRIYDLDRRMADWWRMQYESILGSAQGKYISGEDVGRISADDHLRCPCLKPAEITL